MHERATLLTLAITLGAAALPAASSWGNDPIQEPSSRFDLPQWMWRTANDRHALVNGEIQERLYFNGQLANAFALRNVNLPGGRLEPVLVKADALLGYWRDCNNDGYVGSMYLGMKDYTVPEAALTPHPVDTTVCPPGSQFHIPAGWPGVWRNLGAVIHEFIDVGPARQYYFPWITWQVNDPDARVWGDLGRPDEPRRIAASFRDPAAESPSVLAFPRGTFDSWNGHFRYADMLTFGELSRAYHDTPIVGGDLYAMPFASQATPLRAVRYQAYSQANEDNDWQGRPMVRVWDCAREDAEPTLSPGYDSSGALVDSVNHTFMGARTRLVVPSPVGGGGIALATLYVGPGCDGSAGQQTFNDGLVVPHPEDPTLSATAQKTTVDMFFQYRPPHDQPSDMSTAMWGLVPRLDRTFSATWYGHQVFVGDGAVDRDADYFTFYAKIGPTALAAPAAVPKGSGLSLPGARVVAGAVQVPTWRYGEEACASPRADRNGWDCSSWPAPSAAWDVHFNGDWGVKLGETYHLRDTDCVDLTPAAPVETGIVKENANFAWNYAVTSAGSDVAEAVGENLFTGICE